MNAEHDIYCLEIKNTNIKYYCNITDPSTLRLKVRLRLF